MTRLSRRHLPPPWAGVGMAVIPDGMAAVGAAVRAGGADGAEVGAAARAGRAEGRGVGAAARVRVGPAEHAPEDPAAPVPGWADRAAAVPAWVAREVGAPGWAAPAWAAAAWAAPAWVDREAAAAWAAPGAGVDNEAAPA